MAQQSPDVPLFLRRLPQAVGKMIDGGPKLGWIEILSEPQWQMATGKWNCLANVRNTLSVIEVTVTPEDTQSWNCS